MAKESCLHCLLIAATLKWSRSHNCSTEEFLSMLAQFVAEATVSRPEHRHRTAVEVSILGFALKHETHRLH